MSLRKVSAWGFLVVFIAVGVGAFLGNRLVFAAYVCLGVSSIAYHTVALCRKCGNMACGLNSKSPDYMFRFRRTCGSQEGLGYSKSKPPPWVALWLVLSLLVGLAGTWLFSPAVALALAAVVAANTLLYSTVTCRNCTCACPMNRNAHYWAWLHKQEA